VCTFIQVICLCSYRDTRACKKTRMFETPPGALVLNPGCEVLLGCRGDVSVNGVLLREDTGTLKKNINVANLNGHWVIPDIVNLANEESHSGWRAQETPNYTLNNPSYEDLENGKNSSIKLTKRFRLSQWTLNGKVLRRHKERSGALKLPRLELADAGNYSCIRKGKLLSTIRIIVGIPPKTSAVSCWRKSPKRKIRCEGTVSQLVTPEPECQLLLFQKWYICYCMTFSVKFPCSYSLARSSCRCVVGAVVDGSEYVAQLCVTSIAGNVSSPSINFTAFTLLKPDPPALVKVVRVEGMERLLRVSWSYPTSWRQDYYYGLKFQLRYRPVHGMVSIFILSYWILDAMPRAQYEIQLRAKEEHDLGHWSNWQTSGWMVPGWRLPSRLSSIVNRSVWTHVTSSGAMTTRGRRTARRKMVMWV
uniref:Interleukin 6 receptor n=1 Tax=Denticeps clupeoides TaxID=299321 RepID=A0AAY4AQ13_9TELE